MLSEEDVVEVVVTSEVIVEAHRKSIEMGVLRHSITAGDGNLAAFVGEGVVAEYFTNRGETVDWTNTYEYDMIIDVDVRADVKTKRTSVKPKMSYDCSVGAKRRQDCDVYVFVRVKNDFSVAWILGFMPSKKYFEVANFMEKGIIDPSNGWKVSRDCYNLPIEELRNINDLTKYEQDNA
jgi:transcription antitermination factor NusG